MSAPTESGAVAPSSMIVERLDVSHLVTEDDTPVDNIASEKQMRLLVEPLYSSWTPGRVFMAASNVGIFSALNRPPVVPDMFLSMDVEPDRDWWAKEHRSYFIWEFGKIPEIVVEVVSNKEGGEADRKLREYARISIPYYVIYDPAGHIQDIPLRSFELHATRFTPLAEPVFPELGLSLVRWTGVYEAREEDWLRWADADGCLIPTGAERADREQRLAFAQTQRADLQTQRADFQSERAEILARRMEQERQRADSETQRADSERQRADALEARLRALQDSGG